MKFCPNCGKQTDDAARFCSNCGNVFAENAPAAAESEKSEKTVFIAPDAVQYQAPQQPQAPVQPQYQAPVQPQAPAQPQYQAPVQPQYQVPQQSQIPAEPPKKKMNVGALVAIIVAALLVVAAGVLLILDATETIDFIDIISSGEDKDDKDKNDDDEDETDKDKSDEDETEDETEKDKTETTKAPEKETEALVTEVETTEKAEEEPSRAPVTSGDDFHSRYVPIIVEAPAGFDWVPDDEIGDLDSMMLESVYCRKETSSESYILAFACFDKEEIGVTAEELLEADVDNSISGYTAENINYDTNLYTSGILSVDAYCCDIEAYDETNEIQYYETFCCFEYDGCVVEFYIYAVAEDAVDVDTLNDMFDAFIVD